jgi:hypothetical protein
MEKYGMGNPSCESLTYGTLVHRERRQRRGR